jgi:hypothetical protein
LSGRTADESPEPGAGAFCIKPGYAARDRRALLRSADLSMRLIDRAAVE